MAEFLICIDFEASCYPSKHQSYKGWYQEILEFGAALIDLSDGRIESEFQSYVRPTEFYLTRGCFKKLGISQETLDVSSTLQPVLCDFGGWMRQIRQNYDLVMPWHGRDSDENAFFCSWSNMDLGVYLKNECEHKDITYANYLKWWSDGQGIFRHVYGPNAKLHDAAEHLGTSIVGDAHDALDDAKTLAYIMYDMWENQSFDIKVKRCR